MEGAFLTLMTLRILSMPLPTSPNGEELLNLSPPFGGFRGQKSEIKNPKSEIF